MFTHMGHIFLKHPQSRVVGYLARFWQNPSRNSYLTRFDRKIVILHDSCEDNSGAVI